VAELFMNQSALQIVVKEIIAPADGAVAPLRA
jgi:hypothetical protein